MPSLIDRLSSAALLATQGEWRVMPDERGPFYIDSPQMDRMMSDICGCGDAKDASYIALACPANVQKLLAVVVAAQALRDADGEETFPKSDLWKALDALEKS